MVGTRQLERVLSHAAEAGAKVVLVGDPQQLQSIEAGAAFRSIFERHGGAEIGEVRRQREDWQRDATRDLATGRTGEAIHAYDRQGMLHEAASREQARDDLIEGWDRDRQASPDKSRIILTHTNDEVRALNEAARGRMRDAGDLGDDVRLTVERGERSFARGDRIMFLQNERGLGVKNGTLGTIEEVSAQSHDRAHRRRAERLLRPEGLRPHRPWLCRDHPQGAGHDRGPDPCSGDAGPGRPRQLCRPVATPRRHGAALWPRRLRRPGPAYPAPCRATAPRTWRRITSGSIRRVTTPSGAALPSARASAEIVRKIVPERVRDMFDGLRLAADGGQGRERQAPERKAAEDPEEALRSARTRALVRHARAVDAIFEMQEQGGRASPEQVEELQEARKVFEEVRPYGSHDAEAAYKKNPELAHEAATGQVNRAVRALQLETEIRTEPARRADRFVERWRALGQTSQRQYQMGDMSGYKATRVGDGRHGEKPRTRSAA